MFGVDNLEWLSFLFIGASMLNKQKSNTQQKKDWTVIVVVIGVIILAAWLILRPTASKDSNDFSEQSGYSQELKMISDKYSRCIKQSEYAPSNQSDRMEGTNLSREALSRNDRDSCQRQYDLQMRILKNNYDY